MGRAGSPRVGPVPGLGGAAPGSVGGLVDAVHLFFGLLGGGFPPPGKPARGNPLQACMDFQLSEEALGSSSLLAGGGEVGPRWYSGYGFDASMWKLNKARATDHEPAVTPSELSMGILPRGSRTLDDVHLLNVVHCSRFRAFWCGIHMTLGAVHMLDVAQCSGRRAFWCGIRSRMLFTAGWCAIAGCCML